MNADGQTPYEHNHGQTTDQRQVEFGERVFNDIRKRRRSKLDNCWRHGVYLGTAMAGNENCVSTANGNVTKSTSVVRVVSAIRWDAKLVVGVRGIPGRHNPGSTEEVDPSTEDFQDPHIHADEEGRASAEHHLHDPLETRADALEKNTHITQKDRRTYGYRPECPRCTDLQT